MRETSPFEMPINTLLLEAPEIGAIVTSIRQQKNAQTRPKPSVALIDRSQVLESDQRRLLLDKVAELVDENYCGRSEMCLQFALLLNNALNYLGVLSKIVVGTAIYYDDGREVFRWEHAWVRIGREVVDGNVDTIFENPTVPNSIKVPPYWGPIDETPTDRRLQANNGARIDSDDDVDAIWWPELKEWLSKTLQYPPNNLI